MSPMMVTMMMVMMMVVMVVMMMTIMMTTGTGGTPPQSIRVCRSLEFPWFNRFVVQMGLL